MTLSITTHSYVITSACNCPKATTGQCGVNYRRG